GTAAQRGCRDIEQWPGYALLGTEGEHALSLACTALGEHFHPALYGHIDRVEAQDDGRGELQGLDSLYLSRLSRSVDRVVDNAFGDTDLVGPLRARDPGRRHGRVHEESIL